MSRVPEETRITEITEADQTSTPATGPKKKDLGYALGLMIKQSEYLDSKPISYLLGLFGGCVGALGAYAVCTLHPELDEVVLVPMTSLALGAGLCATAKIIDIGTGMRRRLGSVVLRRLRNPEITHEQFLDLTQLLTHERPPATLRVDLTPQPRLLENGKVEGSGGTDGTAPK